MRFAINPSFGVSEIRIFDFSLDKCARRTHTWLRRTTMLKERIHIEEEDELHACSPECELPTRIVLTEEEWAVFVAAMNDPRPPNERLLRMFRR
ncbi:MAG TPA: DUF1778 domain-containing protein [Kofleriaceae bacterium]|jgi:hypothetical protein